MIRPMDVIAALLAAAGAAGGICGVATALMVVFGGLFSWPLEMSQLLYGFGNALLAAAYVGLGSSIIFLIGLIIIGGPVWFLMHRSGYRTRTAAILAGLLATAPLPLAAWALSPATAASGTMVYLCAVVVAGGVAGWTMHRVAYGRDPEP